jgi:peptidoglycan/LPS O-acetylase OafA/YrhL
VAGQKDVTLEALRGIAAFVVVLHHTALGFFPGNAALLAPLNASAAVSFFFALSGYVLTRRYFEVGDNRILIRGAVKRWPRLMGPVLLVVLASYGLFQFGLYRFEHAGAVVGSPWLASFGHSGIAQPIRFWDAFAEGAVLAFVSSSHANFDSSLWTMHPELVGSFLAFGFAPILLRARKSSLLLCVALIVIVAIAAHLTHLAAFPIGAGLAALLPRGLAISGRIACPALAVALYLLGFSGDFSGVYAPLYYLPRLDGITIIGAALLIATVETFPPIRKACAGRVSRFVGELSFPIYLVHVPVICSAGAAVYQLAGGLMAAVAALIVSVLVSLPLIAFNKWWIKQMNAVAESIVRVDPLGAALERAV